MHAAHRSQAGSCSTRPRCQGQRRSTRATPARVALPAAPNARNCAVARRKAKHTMPWTLSLVARAFPKPGRLQGLGRSDAGYGMQSAPTAALCPGLPYSQERPELPQRELGLPSQPYACMRPRPSRQTVRSRQQRGCTAHQLCRAGIPWLHCLVQRAWKALPPRGGIVALYYTIRAVSKPVGAPGLCAARRPGAQLACRFK